MPLYDYLDREKINLTLQQANCLTALDKNDFETFLRIGHQLKGNAASFGFEDLGLIALELENAAKESDINKIKTSLTKFESFLKNK